MCIQRVRNIREEEGEYKDDAGHQKNVNGVDGERKKGSRNREEERSCD